MEETEMYYTIHREKINYPEVTLRKILLNKPIPEKTKLREYTTVEIPDTTNFTLTENAIRFRDYILNSWESLSKSNIQLYSSFKIPKKSGGLREIDAPIQELKTIQSTLAYWLQDELHILPHDAAYAYVKGRSHIESLKKHQNMQAKWFLKIDFSNFFPAHNKEYILNMLEQVYPIGALIKNDRAVISKMLDICLLNDKLPQGTPVSPALTNICMVPIDYAITNLCITLGKKYNTFFTYTRYADDIIISAGKSFKWTDVIKEIENILNNFNAPFKINNKKTRYGSNAGRNWNVGLMLNKDNRITLGHKNNKILNAKINRFCYENIVEKKTWTVPEIQELQGNIAYAKAVDPDYTNYILHKYTVKYKTNVEQYMKNMLY